MLWTWKEISTGRVKNALSSAWSSHADLFDKYLTNKFHQKILQSGCTQLELTLAPTYAVLKSSDRGTQALMVMEIASVFSKGLTEQCWGKCQPA